MVTPTNIELAGTRLRPVRLSHVRRVPRAIGDVAGVDPPLHSSFGQQIRPETSRRPALAFAPKLPVHCRQRVRRPAADATAARRREPRRRRQLPWRDSLGREFDFYLEHFPEDPGPREIIIPHNPMITREMDVQVGDILIGRPLGMSCGCPITHCGVATDVDHAHRRDRLVRHRSAGPAGKRASRISATTSPKATRAGQRSPRAS